MNNIFKVSFLFLSLFLTQIFPQKTHQLNSNSEVKEFFISGPYTNEKGNNINPIDMLDMEYIKDEHLFHNDKIFFNGQIIQSNDGTHDINSVLDDTSFAVAYLFSQINSEESNNAFFLISATDGTKLYVNGKELYAFYGNNFHVSVEPIIVPLKKGVNDVVLKVPNKDWDWKLKLKILKYILINKFENNIEPR